MLRRCLLPLVISLAASALLTGCSKPSENNAAGSAAAVAESGPLIAEFTSIDPSLWVNGAPMSLAKARGSVVLIEAWGVW